MIEKGIRTTKERVPCARAYARVHRDDLVCMCIEFAHHQFHTPLTHTISLFHMHTHTHTTHTQPICHTNTKHKKQTTLPSRIHSKLNKNTCKTHSHIHSQTHTHTHTNTHTTNQNERKTERERQREYELQHKHTHTQHNTREERRERERCAWRCVRACVRVVRGVCCKDIFCFVVSLFVPTSDSACHTQRCHTVGKDYMFCILNQDPTHFRHILSPFFTDTNTRTQSHTHTHTCAF